MDNGNGRATRRSLLQLVASALACGARPLHAAEDEWPSRSVTLVVPFAPGGSNDVAARLIAPALSDRIGRQIVVDNRAGAGGAVGMGQAARARPDGYSLLLSSASSHVFNHLIVRNQGYDPREAFAGVGIVNDVPLALTVWPGSGIDSIKGLIERSRSTSGSLSFGSSGVGSSAHLAGELFAMQTGAKLEHVPYRGGGPALTDLMAGTLPVAWLTLPAVMAQLGTGTIRVLGIASAERSTLQPDLPTVQEQGVSGYAVRSWTGIFAQRGTPQPIVDRLSKELHAVVQDTRMREKLIEIGSEPIWLGPVETDHFVRDEFARWSPVITRAGLGK